MTLFSGPVYLPGGTWYHLREGWCPSDPWFAELRAEMPWRQASSETPGGTILNPRLEAWWSADGRGYGYAGTEHPSAPMPPRVAAILRVLNEQTAVDKRYNACFANLYRDGRDSLGWHQDDEPVLGDVRRSQIATVSLGAAREFQIRPRGDGQPVAIRLEGGSLFVMGPGMQAGWLHRIPKTDATVGERISLTFRRVVS